MIKEIPFGTKIITKHGTVYRVLSYEPNFYGHIQNTTGMSIQHNGEDKTKGKIFVYCEETRRANWHSLEDFNFEII